MDGLGGRIVGIECEEGAGHKRGSGSLEDGNGMRDSNRERRLGGSWSKRGWKRNAGIGDLIQIGDDMVTKTRRVRAGCREAGNRRREETNGLEPKAHPTTSVNGIAIKSRSSRPRL
jgi:hypothetical protein